MIKILSGDDYQIKVYQQTLIDQFLTDNDPLSLENIDIETNDHLEMGDLLNSLTTISLFNSRKLVILKNLSSKSDLQDKIELLFSKVTKDVSLIIIEPKLDKKTKFAKFLQAQAGYIEYKPYKTIELENWLITRAKQAQTQLSRQLAAYLIEKAGTEALILETEIEKLKVYPTITQNLIDDLVVPTHNSQTFALLDALMKGNLKKTVILYQDQRQQKTMPLNILGLFVWQLRLLLIAKKNTDPTARVAADFKLSPYAFNKAKALAVNMHLSYLNSLIELCYQTDKRIREQFVDPDEALLFFIFKGCQLKKAS